MNIIQKPCSNFRVGRKEYKPEVIVLHIMAGSLTGTDEWFANPESQVSSNYGVGFEGEIHQYVRDEDTAWTEGRISKPTFKLFKGMNVNPNLYCLSVEHEGQDLSMATETQLNASAELIAALVTKWAIPVDRDHIIGHYEIYSLKPNCPATDKAVIDRLIEKVALLTNPIKSMKFVKFYESNSNEVITYFVNDKVLQNDGQTHQFTSPEDAQAKSTNEVFIFWDGKPIGAGLVSE